MNMKKQRSQKQDKLIILKEFGIVLLGARNYSVSVPQINIDNVFVVVTNKIAAMSITRRKT